MIETADRDAIIEALEAAGIPTDVVEPAQSTTDSPNQGDEREGVSDGSRL